MSVEIGSLGLSAGDRIALARKVHAGLLAAQVRRLLRASGLTQEELFRAAHLPVSTGRRRLAEGRFTDHESERIARIARIHDAATRVFGHDARSWLTEDNPRLGGRPLDVAGTELGAIEVEALLGRLVHGVY